MELHAVWARPSQDARVQEQDRREGDRVEGQVRLDPADAAVPACEGESAAGPHIREQNRHRRRPLGARPQYVVPVPRVRRRGGPRRRGGSDVRWLRSAAAWRGATRSSRPSWRMGRGLRRIRRGGLGRLSRRLRPHGRRAERRSEFRRRPVLQRLPWRLRRLRRLRRGWRSRQGYRRRQQRRRRRRRKGFRGWGRQGVARPRPVAAWGREGQGRRAWR
mmetsp:Transcript_107830/g.311579  ORF Transcript_107830/g.311579 Transcript_107830/m.311579 type:complete len:218 (+) Transcript_107830:444-1097(+)